MDNNSLLMIMLAFVVGYCLPSMMKNMCGGRLVEGNIYDWANRTPKQIAYARNHSYVDDLKSGIGDLGNMSAHWMD